MAYLYLKLVLYTLCHFSYCWLRLGKSDVLCRYGSAVLDTTFISSVIVLKLLNGRLSEIWIVLMSNLSSTAGLVTYALASFTWVMFLGKPYIFHSLVGLLFWASAVQETMKLASDFWRITLF